MTSCIHRRVGAASFAALSAVILPTFACSGGSGGSAPFEIVSPSSRTVVVQPGESVRFEIRANGGRILLIAGVQLRQIGRIRALQERRAEKHLVQFMSRHLNQPCR